MPNQIQEKLHQQIFKRLAYKAIKAREKILQPRFAFIGFGLFWFWLGYWFAQTYKDLIMIAYGLGLTFIGYSFYKVKNNENP